MTINDIIKHFNIPSHMVYIKQESMLFSDLIIINKGEYLIFNDEVVTFMSYGILVSMKNIKDIEKILLKSKKYNKFIRTEKLKKLNYE